MDWLGEQLDSINDQSCEQLELLVMDDFSTEVAFEEIRKCVEARVTRMPYRIFRNEENMGSTKVFEKLTLLADGEYIAYCDQDDVWHKNKLEKLLSLFKNGKISMAFSDVRIIDANGNIIANSITEFRPRHILYEGRDLFNKLIIQNFVIGCTMLIKREMAKGAIPIIPDMVHDHYLAMMASLNGELALCSEPLVSYRIHDSNQTNTLAKIKNKKDYYNYKIMAFYHRIEQLENINCSRQGSEFEDIKKWADSRDKYYSTGKLKYAKCLWRYKYFDFKLSLFELTILRMPNLIFTYFLYMIKEGKI